MIDQYAPTTGQPPLMLGPGDANVSNIGGKALIRYSDTYGYTFIAGKQNSDITITYEGESDSLRFRDTGTGSFVSVPDSCTVESAGSGVSALCAIPDAFDGRQMFVQVWPRLGDDRVDGSTLSARFRLWALVDAGNDVVLGGAGDDFVNGALGNDVVDGGAGDDWIRGGPGSNRINGGSGNNRISNG